MHYAFLEEEERVTLQSTENPWYDKERKENNERKRPLVLERAVT